MKRLGRYLWKNPSCRLLTAATPPDSDVEDVSTVRLEAWCYVDWTGDSDRRSVSEFVTTMNVMTLSTTSRAHTALVVATFESEIYDIVGALHEFDPP